MSTPFIGFSNETLKNCEAVKAGDKVPCPVCGELTVVEDSEPPMLQCISHCGKDFVVGIDGKYIGNKAPDVFVLKPGGSIILRIDNLREVKFHANIPPSIVADTDKGSFVIPNKLRHMIFKGCVYEIKAVYNHRLYLKIRHFECLYCGGRGCKECDYTGLEPVINYIVSEMRRNEMSDETYECKKIETGDIEIVLIIKTNISMTEAIHEAIAKLREEE